MECNKDEALRARSIAEQKMKAGDFLGAQKVALKARQLYPELENISQLLTVCEVHCSAQLRVNVSEMDWYSILQVEKFSDEIVIKKQYKKLALVLHPDKNKFPGAEAAFKIISEANTILTDPAKRSFYDTKCKGALKQVNSKPPTAKPSNRKMANPPVHPPTAKPSSRRTANPSQRSKPVIPDSSQAPPTGFYPFFQKHQRNTFWTLCPLCKTRYQYFSEYVGKMLSCQYCRQSFLAHDFGSNVVPPTWNSFSVPPEVVNQGPSNATSQNDCIRPTVMQFPGGQAKAERSASDGSTKPEGSQAGSSRDVGNRDMPPEGNEETKFKSSYDQSNEKSGNEDTQQQKTDETKFRNPEVSTNAHFKKSNVKADGDVSMGTGDKCDKNENISRTSKENQVRKSSRKRRQVSYDEADSDKEDESSDKKFRSFESAREDSDSKKTDKDEVVEDANMEQSTGDLSSDDICGAKDDNHHEKLSELEEGETPGSPNINCPDSDFFDFNLLREEHCFKVGQIWACFDPLDGMPRFYACISKIFPNDFKVRISWLEAFPLTEDEEVWCDANLPSACGRYVRGDSQVTEDLLMFSHPMVFEKDKRNKYFLYPRKGDTWALFKNWDIKWGLDYENHQPPYQLDYVEIITDFDKESGVEVAFLKQVEGFISVFRRDEVDTFHILPNEVFRFSHAILSRRLSGTEADGIQEGFLELDTASLPSNFSEFSRKCSDSDSLENDGKQEDAERRSDVGMKTPVKDESMTSSQDGSNVRRSPRESVKRSSLGAATNMNGTAPPSRLRHIVEVKDYDFKQERSLEKFQVGQVWALFSKKDNLPRDFAVVKDCMDEKLLVAMLCTTSSLNDAVRSTCIGTFRATNASKLSILAPSSFSHLVNAEVTAKNDYLIRPRSGEVWAMYKNVNSSSDSSEKVSDSLDFVEITKESATTVTVVMLEQMVGHTSFYRLPTAREVLKMTREIPAAVFHRFSHQCCAIKHKGEEVKHLKNCWEIDPSSRPPGVILLE